MQDAGINQLPAHLSHKATTNVSDLDIIVFDRLKSLGPMGWNVTPCPVRSAQEGSVCVDGHDAGNNGYINTLCANFADPIDEDVSIIEHLSDDEGSARIDLLLEVVDELVNILIVVAPLRIACNTNVEVVAIFVLDVFDQVLCVAETAGCSLPLLPLTWGVTPQCKDVGTASVVGVAEGFVELGSLHIGACQVHEGLKTVDGLGDLDHLGGELRVATTCAPGDVDELRAKAMHAVHAIV
jgi:hypothetical protein